MTDQTHNYRLSGLDCSVQQMDHQSPGHNQKSQLQKEKEDLKQLILGNKQVPSQQDQQVQQIKNLFNNGRSSHKRELKQVSHFLIQKTLGEGTFGKVKLGIHTITKEKVAIKILEKSKIQDQTDVDRIAREIKILKKIRHPNIIQLYQIIETERELYLIMEHADAGELFDYIVRHERVSNDQAAKYLQQILDGVQHLHENGVVHRDLKPENLLLDGKANHLKIIDFGLSNMYKPGQLLSTACGSPCYAAPEMIAGKKYRGLPADIWSCGVILFAMICGYLPFEDPDTNKLYKKILKCQYSIPDFVEPSARDLIQKILNTDPTKRYGLQDIRSHPWFTKYINKSENDRNTDQAIDLKEIRINPEIVQQMHDNFSLPLSAAQSKAKYGNPNQTSENFLIQDTLRALSNNKHNDYTTTYYLLHKKWINSLKSTSTTGRSFMNQSINSPGEVQADFIAKMEKLVTLTPENYEQIAYKMQLKQDMNKTKKLKSGEKQRQSVLSSQGSVYHGQKVNSRGVHDEVTSSNQTPFVQAEKLDKSQEAGSGATLPTGLTEQQKVQSTRYGQKSRQKDRQRKLKVGINQDPNSVMSTPQGPIHPDDFNTKTSLNTATGFHDSLQYHGTSEQKPQQDLPTGLAINAKDSIGISQPTFHSAQKQYSHRYSQYTARNNDLNQTRISKESGTNVSYQSNYSAIKSNILKFKNKRVGGARGGEGNNTSQILVKQGVVSRGIKLPIPVQRAGAQTPGKNDYRLKNNLACSSALDQQSQGSYQISQGKYGTTPFNPVLSNTAKKPNGKSMIDTMPVMPQPRNSKFLKTVNIELKQNSHHAHSTRLKDPNQIQKDNQVNKVFASGQKARISQMQVNQKNLASNGIVHTAQTQRQQRTKDVFATAKNSTGRVLVTKLKMQMGQSTRNSVNSAQVAGLNMSHATAYENQTEINSATKRQTQLSATHIQSKFQGRLQARRATQVIEPQNSDLRPHPSGQKYQSNVHIKKKPSDKVRPGQQNRPSTQIHQYVSSNLRAKNPNNNYNGGVMGRIQKARKLGAAQDPRNLKSDTGHHHEYSDSGLPGPGYQSNRTHGEDVHLAQRQKSSLKSSTELNRVDSSDYQEDHFEGIQRGVSLSKQSQNTYGVLRDQLQYPKDQHAARTQRGQKPQENMAGPYYIRQEPQRRSHLSPDLENADITEENRHSHLVFNRSPRNTGMVSARKNKYHAYTGEKMKIDDGPFCINNVIVLKDHDQPDPSHNSNDQIRPTYPHQKVMKMITSVLQKYRVGYQQQSEFKLSIYDTFDNLRSLRGDQAGPPQELLLEIRNHRSLQLAAQKGPTHHSMFLLNFSRGFQDFTVPIPTQVASRNSRTRSPTADNGGYVRIKDKILKCFDG